MPSNLFKIVSEDRSPETILGNIYSDIVDCERNVTLPFHVSGRIHECDGMGRNWGDTSYARRPIKYKLDGEKFIVTISREVYSRSCYMGDESDEMVISDSIVQRHELYLDDKIDWQEYSDTLIEYNKGRALAFVIELENKDARERAEAAEKAREAEEAERAKFEELKAKFEG